MLWWTVRQLKSSNWRNRAEAAMRLGSSGQTKAVPALIRALDDDNEQVRLAAVQALRMLRHAAAAEPLARSMEKLAQRPQAQPAEYEALADALGSLGAGAVPALLRLLGSEEREPRRWAAHALGLTRDSRAVDPLIKRLADPRLEVRKSAALALGHIGDRRALAALVQAISSRDHETRRAAVTALGMIGGEPAVDALSSITEDASEPVQLAVVEALSRIGGMRAAGCLRSIMDGSRKAVRDAATAALGALKLEASDASERAAAAVITGDFAAAAREGEAALGALASALSSKDSARRRSAAETLGKLHVAGAVDPLLRAARDYDPAVQNAAAAALVSTGPAALDGLIAMLSHHDPTAQCLAARCLGEIADPRTTAALTDVIEQNRTVSNEFPELFEVVQAAAVALDAILVARIAEIADPDLQRVAALPAAVRHAAKPEPVIDCSSLLDQASQELRRRLGTA